MVVVRRSYQSTPVNQPVPWFDYHVRRGVHVAYWRLFWETLGVAFNSPISSGQEYRGLMRAKKKEKEKKDLRRASLR